MFHTEVQLPFALTVTKRAASVRKSDPKRTVTPLSQGPWVFYTAEGSNENQSGLSAAVRQPQKNPIPYKSIPKSANSTREIPQSGVNSRILEFESRCTGVPKCRPSEK